MAAPKGNHNALKHGLYANHFTPAESDDLRQMAWNNLIFEINGSRSMAEKAMALVYRLMAESDPDVDKIVGILNTWNSLARSIGMLVLRHSTLTGENPGLIDSLAEALAGLPLHEPDPEEFRK
jgi:hypothetical protein